MRIFADKVQLADHGQVEALRISGGRQLQVDEFVRGEEVEIRDRMNESTDITFTVNRLHASVVDAERYILEHATKVPRRPETVLLIADWGGPKIEKKLIRPGVAIVDSSYWGCHTVHQYRIMGGKVV